MSSKIDELFELLSKLSSKGPIDVPGVGTITTVDLTGKSREPDPDAVRVETKLRAGGYDDNAMCQLGAVMKTLHHWGRIQEFDDVLLHLAVHHDVLPAAKLSNDLNQFILRCGEEMQKAEAVAGESCSPHRYTKEDYDNLKYNADKTAIILADCQAKHDLLKSAATTH